MRTTETRLANALRLRLSDLSEWLAGALEYGELRDKDSVDLAKSAFLKWICDCWDDGAGDTDGALSRALESYVESGPQWADVPESLQEDLQIAADPAWTIPEFHLLVASMLADHALLAFRRGTSKHFILAAMLYADAIECRERWDQQRGPAGARNPDTWSGRIQAKLRHMDELIAEDKSRKLVARKANSAKLAKDPKVAAMNAIYSEWEMRGRPRAAFAREMAIQYQASGVDIAEGSIKNAMTRWRKKSSSC